MVNNEKKKITLSIPVETNNTLEEMARKHGMTKSGLIFNQGLKLGLAVKGNINVEDIFDSDL